MPFIPAPAGTTRAVFSFSLQGQECQIVQYHNVGAVDPSAAELLAFANQLHGTFATSFDAVLVNELVLNTVTCTLVETDTGLQAVSTNAPHTFSVNVPSANNALAILYSLGTGLAGRSFRGRMFVPGARGDNLAADSNYWLAGYITQLVTAGDDYLADVNALSPVGATLNEWSVASYYSGTSGPPLHTPIARAEAVITPIASIALKSRIATQRRRRPRS